jgi:hypothetical protein
MTTRLHRSEVRHQIGRLVRAGGPHISVKVIERHLGYPLSEADHANLTGIFAVLSAAADGRAGTSSVFPRELLRERDSENPTVSMEAVERCLGYPLDEADDAVYRGVRAALAALADAARTELGQPGGGTSMSGTAEYPAAAVRAAFARAARESRRVTPRPRRTRQQAAAERLVGRYRGTAHLRRGRRRGPRSRSSPPARPLRSTGHRRSNG